MNDFKDITVAVAGTGYVGLSIATLLSQHHHVTAVDVIPGGETLQQNFSNLGRLHRKVFVRKAIEPCGNS